MREHCWHQGSMEYLSYPSQHDEKCCFCGKERRVRGAFVEPAGHGPHVTVRHIHEIAEDVGPCEPSSVAPEA